MTYIRRNERAAPNGQSFADLNWRSMTFAIIWLSVPPRRSGVRNEPSAGMNVMMTPETIPGSASGTTTDANVRSWLAPRSRLASRYERSSRSRAA